MKVIQRNITTVSKASGLNCDRFYKKSNKLINSNTPEQKGEVNENQESTYPVWDGSFDEPIWW